MNDEQLKRVLRQTETPQYVFDIVALKERVKYLRRHLPEKTILCYAIKANPFITRELSGCVDRFEVCSPGEGAICEQLKIDPKKMVISGVYKTPAYIEHLVRDCPDIGHYTVESVSQALLLEELAEKYHRKLPVLLRLTSGNQFGLDEEELREIIRSKQFRLDIRGIQYFSGTQKHSLKRIARELEKLDSLMLALKQEEGFKVRELEYGPGLQVCYFQDDQYDEKAFLEGFSQLLAARKAPGRLTLELGRSIAASCGTYLTTVVDAKRNQGQNYAIVDGGIHHLVYYGQSMAMRIPKHRFFPPRGGEGEKWNLFGSLCTVNDCLVKQLPADGLRIGDCIAFENTGAYCMTEGISLFLSRDLPGVSLLLEDGTVLPVRSAVATSILNTPVYYEKGK